MSRIFVALCLLLAVSPATADPKADEADVRLIIGGHFEVDHIGPTAHAAVLQRAKARPRVYLAITERLALASTHESLSSTYIPYAIELLKPSARTEAIALAKKLLPLYQKARAATTGDPSRRERLDQRIATLQLLVK